MGQRSLLCGTSLQHGALHRLLYAKHLPWHYRLMCGHKCKCLKGGSNFLTFVIHCDCIFLSRVHQSKTTKVMLQSHCACGFVSCVPVIISTCDCVFVWLRECVYIYIFWKAAHAVPLVLNSAATSQPILNTGRSTHPPTALSPCQSLSLPLCFSLPDRDHALDMDMALLSFRVWCLFVSVVMCIILLISPYITAWYKQCTFPANLTSCHHVGPLSALIRRFVINWPVPPVVF